MQQKFYKINRTDFNKALNKVWFMSSYQFMWTFKVCEDEIR